ncbi:MAG: M23 family metallopeptidase [Bacteroidales bacterium]|nr:M23 family metallopeptidase [Bacteroidales bacterium]
MSNRYILDDDNNVRKVRTSFWVVLRKILMFIVVTASLSVVYYLILACFFSTDTEKELIQENRMYEKLVPQMQEKEKLLADVVEGLELRDNRIYDEIFHADAPSINPFMSLSSLSGIDTIPDTKILNYSKEKLDRIETVSARVEDNFEAIFAAIEGENFVMPPMVIPIDNFSFARTGASVGERINPFYKVPMAHNGIDLIASTGEPVHAAADGIVREVVRSRKGLGNVVTIEHDGGYITRYAHLADVEVYRGRTVRMGSRLGYVGVSGNSFAPHLHYEVHKDTVVLDPVNYFFASLRADEYVNMLVMAASTGQSMD